MRTVRERLVPAGAGRLRSGEGAATDAKDYFDRVAKYVPTEIVAAYISANGAASLSRHEHVLVYVIFGLCLILTPLYITRFTTTPTEAWTNGGMATAAFVVWAYATGGGLFDSLDWYDAGTAAVVLVFFTLLSGLAIPIKEKPAAKPQILNPPPVSPEV
jgi:hypothetical protein